MEIIVDTREQKPLWKAKFRRRTLRTGDYTTEKLFNIFHIERKSAMDLYGSITRGHVRLRNMFIRGNNGMTTVLFVECSEARFCSMRFAGADRLYYYKFPGRVKKIIDGIIRNWKIEVTWCNSRAAMQRAMLARFKAEERKLKANDKKRIPKKV